MNCRILRSAGSIPQISKSITILKDAAATAIYGAKAANGVIVITTKKGRQGKLRVNFSGGVFYTLKPDLGKLNLMNSSEKVDFELGLASRSDLDYRSDYGEVSRLLSKIRAIGCFEGKWVQRYFFRGTGGVSMLCADKLPIGGW